MAATLLTGLLLFFNFTEKMKDDEIKWSLEELKESYILVILPHPVNVLDFSQEAQDPFNIS